MKKHMASCLPVLFTVAACTSGPPTHTFVLMPSVEHTAFTPIHASPGVPIVIRRVLVPDYLDTTEIVLREGGNEVKASETGRWGERLSQGITHAVASDLAKRFPSNLIVLDTAISTQRQLLISVTALDLWTDGRCAIAASWTIVDHGTPLAVVKGSGTFTSTPSEITTSASDVGLVDSISRTVDKLADAISIDIRHTTD